MGQSPSSILNFMSESLHDDYKSGIKHPIEVRSRTYRGGENGPVFIGRLPRAYTVDATYGLARVGGGRVPEERWRSAGSAGEWLLGPAVASLPFCFSSCEPLKLITPRLLARGVFYIFFKAPRTVERLFADAD